MSLSRIFWQIQVPGFTCDIHEDPVVWEVHLITLLPKWTLQSDFGGTEN